MRGAVFVSLCVVLLGCTTHIKALTLHSPKHHKSTPRSLHQAAKDLEDKASFWEHRARARRQESKHDRKTFLNQISSESNILPDFILDLARGDLEQTHTTKGAEQEPATTTLHTTNDSAATSKAETANSEGDTSNSELQDVVFSDPDLPKGNIPTPDQSRHSKTKKRYGVPLRDTHSHLVGRDEVTPGMPLSEYQQRREKLGELMKDGDVAVFPSGQKKFMSGDTEYEFQQSTNLLYLTGIADPSVIVVISKQEGKVQFVVLLGAGGGMGQFDSDNLDLEVLKSDFGADQVLNKHDASVAEILSSASRILLDSSINPPVADEMRKLAGDVAVDDQLAVDLVASLRQYKSPLEIALLTKVFEISARAHVMSMRVTSVGGHEAFLRGVTGFLLEREYAHHAYPPIIAGGVNGHVLHYHADDDLTRDGNMILMDVGGRRFEYCADITRTWPVNCRFSATQREIYSIVLRVQQAVIVYAKQYSSHPIFIEDLETESKRLMSQELHTLGLGHVALRQVMPHGVSHSLGMDVHDVTQDSAPIKDGFVFTVEPGLYFPDDESIPEKYRGINVRIEDDCIAMGDDIVCPSQLVPSDMDEIEKICGSALKK